ncbi:MAG: MFS transporter [Chitinophagaceae bacterium]|nr:MFS transporter [Chitinophagaceae bacterium]
MRLSKTIKILLFASSLWYFGEGLFGPLFAIFTEKVGGDLLDITWAWSAYLVVTGLMYFLVGRTLKNSAYKKEVMIFGYALNTVFTFSYLLVDSVTTLFIVQVGLGIAESLSTPIWESLFANDLEDSSDTFHWGLATGHTHFVTGIAVAIGGLITYYISFHVLFIVMGVIQATATIIQSRLLFIKNKDL